jgi:hypothetical protein
MDVNVPQGGMVMDVKLVGVGGFEPPTSWSQTMRANPLRHTPISKLTSLSVAPGGTIPNISLRRSN